MRTQPYRKYKCTRQWYDESSMQIMSTEKIMDLSTVIGYEEFVDPKWNDGKKRTEIEFMMNQPPCIILLSLKEFEEIHEKYLQEAGTLDLRSQKKKLTYNGPVATYFDIDPKIMVTTMYPKGFDFNSKTYDQIQDGLLTHILTPFN